MRDEVSIISEIIAVWGWHIIAWMFFLKSLGFLLIQRYPWFFGLMGVFLLCEIIALNKKWRVEKQDE